MFRSAAHIKQHIRRYINEGHDVTNAEEFLMAAESYGGVKATRFAVGEIRELTPASKYSKMKLKGISSYFSFRYESAGIRCWKPYNIGDGNLFPYKNFDNNLNSQFIPQPNSKNPQIHSETAWYLLASKPKADTDVRVLLTNNASNEAQAPSEEGEGSNVSGALFQGLSEGCCKSYTRYAKLSQAYCLRKTRIHS